MRSGVGLVAEREEEFEAEELVWESERLRRRGLRWRSSHGFEAEELAGAEGGRWAFTEERRRTPRGLGKR